MDLTGQQRFEFGPRLGIMPQCLYSEDLWAPTCGRAMKNAFLSNKAVHFCVVVDASERTRVVIPRLEQKRVWIGMMWVSSLDPPTGPVHLRVGERRVHSGSSVLCRRALPFRVRWHALQDPESCRQGLQDVAPPPLPTSMRSMGCEWPRTMWREQRSGIM